MKIYEAPTLEVTKLDSTDIVTASAGDTPFLYRHRGAFNQIQYHCCAKSYGTNQEWNKGIYENPGLTP